jgi:hypothetical protein
MGILPQWMEILQHQPLSKLSGKTEGYLPFGYHYPQVPAKGSPSLLKIFFRAQASLLQF